MAIYGDVSNIIELAQGSITESDITGSIQEVVSGWIDENIYRAGFGEAISAAEFYDIKNDNQTELILKNFPVVSFTKLTDTFQADDAVEVNSDCYIIDNDSGILQLVTAYKTISGNDVINLFSKGFNSVKAEYTYGYENVPSIIGNIANLMIAKWVKMEEQQANADGLKSVSIGDYKETFDTAFMSLKSEYDGTLDGLIKQAKAKYAKGY